MYCCRYTSITLWEVSLPPPVIATYYDPQQQTNVIEEIKFLALKGYEVYSCILEKICFFGTDLDGENIILFIICLWSLDSWRNLML